MTRVIGRWCRPDHPQLLIAAAAAATTAQERNVACDALQRAHLHAESVLCYVSECNSSFVVRLFCTFCTEPGNVRGRKKILGNVLTFARQPLRANVEFHVRLKTRILSFPCAFPVSAILLLMWDNFFLLDSQTISLTLLHLNRLKGLRNYLG